MSQDFITTSSRQPGTTLCKFTLQTTQKLIPAPFNGFLMEKNKKKKEKKKRKRSPEPVLPRLGDSGSARGCRRRHEGSARGCLHLLPVPAAGGLRSRLRRARKGFWRSYSLENTRRWEERGSGQWFASYGYHPQVLVWSLQSFEAKVC